MRVNVLGFIPVIGEDYDIYLIKYKDKEIDKTIAVRFKYPNIIKSHIREEKTINLVSTYWMITLTKILKFRGIK